MISKKDKKYSKERIKGKESVIKVAAIQTIPFFGEKDKNVNRQIELIKQASANGNSLIVLPELGNTGYIFNNRNELEELAEEIPNGPTCQEWLSVCQEEKVYLCAGIAERDKGKYYDSAVLIGPGGFIGKYRKTHLWDEDKLWFEPGDLGFPIFDLKFGRVGILICYDGWKPEVPRILALQGADIICDPAAWVFVPGVITLENSLSPYIHLAHAHMNNIFMVCSVRAGEERGCAFLGNSCIAGPSGFIAGPASVNKEEIVSAEINLSQSRYKHWSELASVLTDRRVDLYDELLGYNPLSQVKEKRYD